MKANNTQRGISLLEMTFASAIFMVVIVSVIPLIDGMVGRFQMARDHYVATSICQSRVERARMVPYSDLRLFAESQSFLNDVGDNDPNGRFKRVTTVSTNSPAAGLTTMTVSTYICLCSRYGWRKSFHPIYSRSFTCKFTDEKEQLSYIYTTYNQ
jgi:type II secretory pathway pseudopilin PulG